MAKVEETGPGQAAKFNPGTGEQWAQCVGCGGWTMDGRRCARCEAEAWCALNDAEAQAARDWEVAHGRR